MYCHQHGLRRAVLLQAHRLVVVLQESLLATNSSPVIPALAAAVHVKGAEMSQMATRSAGEQEKWLHVPVAQSRCCEWCLSPSGMSLILCKTCKDIYRQSSLKLHFGLSTQSHTMNHRQREESKGCRRSSNSGRRRLGWRRAQKAGIRRHWVFGAVVCGGQGVQEVDGGGCGCGGGGEGIDGELGRDGVVEV